MTACATSPVKVAPPPPVKLSGSAPPPHSPPAGSVRRVVQNVNGRVLAIVTSAGTVAKNPADSKKISDRRTPAGAPSRVPTTAPTRGGDGGVAPRSYAPGGGHQHALDNRRVVLTGADERVCVPTVDPFDRAHGMRDGGGRLLSGAVEGSPGCYKPRQGTRARMYHASQLVAREYERRVSGLDEDGRPAAWTDVLVRGISLDSAADSLFEAQQRLEGIPGLGPAGPGPSVHERLRARLVAERGYLAARAVMSPDPTGRRNITSDA